MNLLCVQNQNLELLFQQWVTENGYSSVKKARTASIQETIALLGKDFWATKIWEGQPSPDLALFQQQCQISRALHFQHEIWNYPSPILILISLSVSFSKKYYRNVVEFHVLLFYSRFKFSFLKWGTVFPSRLGFEKKWSWLYSIENKFFCMESVQKLKVFIIYFPLLILFYNRPKILQTRR